MRPVIKSPRECKRILIDSKDLKFKIFMCHKEKSELRGTEALKYIKWGEAQGFHKRPSCRGRARWWDVGDHSKPTHVWQKTVNDRHIQSHILIPSFVDQRLYEMTYNLRPMALTVVLNCAVLILMKELEGRVNLGEGALDTAVFEANNIQIINPNCLDERECTNIIEKISKHNVLDINSELKHAERKFIDDIVFDVLNLTKGEREAVYEAVINLVESRLQKANSLKPKDRKKRSRSAGNTLGIWKEMPDDDNGES